MHWWMLRWLGYGMFASPVTYYDVRFEEFFAWANAHSRRSQTKLTTKFLEAAQLRARIVEPGETVVISLPLDQRSAFDTLEAFIQQVDARCASYGLSEGVCCDWEFIFVKSPHLQAV